METKVRWNCCAIYVRVFDEMKTEKSERKSEKRNVEK